MKKSHQMTHPVYRVQQALTHKAKLYQLRQSIKDKQIYKVFSEHLNFLLS